MLPKMGLRSNRFLILLLLAAAFLVLTKANSPKAFHLIPPEIIKPPAAPTVLSGYQSIEIYDEQAETVDIVLFDAASGTTGPCYTIVKGLEFNPQTKIASYNWNTATVVDSNDFYQLLVTTHYAGDHTGTNAKLIVVDNNKSGEPCSEPYEPPINPPPPTSSDSSVSSSNTTSQSDEEESTQPQLTSSKKTTTESGSQGTGEPTVAGGSKKVERKDALVIFDEEIPITLDRFDPDIFLKGEAAKITSVLSKTREGQNYIRFEGTADPSTLVTLYIFSTPVIVVVKSDLTGNWHYDRDKKLESGSHTVFATVYDDGVTRRTDTVDFFVAAGTKDGQSLLLAQSGLNQIFPYAAVLAGALAAAILILTVFRIYSKRKLVT